MFAFHSFVFLLFALTLWMAWNFRKYDKRTLLKRRWLYLPWKSNNKWRPLAHSPANWLLGIESLQRQITLFYFWVKWKAHLFYRSGSDNENITKQTIFWGKSKDIISLTNFLIGRATSSSMRRPTWISMRRDQPDLLWEDHPGLLWKDQPRLLWRRPMRSSMRKPTRSSMRRPIKSFIRRPIMSSSTRWTPGIIWEDQPGRQCRRQTWSSM